MVNHARGEVAVVIGGDSYTLCLSLNALAEIEDALGLDSMDEIGTAMERPKSKNLAAIIGAMMRGGGHDISDDEIGDIVTMKTMGDATKALQDAMAAGSPEPSEKPAKKARRAKPRGAGGKK